ncbi:hypothetical protein LX36DRAFT_220404 [Colletotrichum falcatum]|nr:hypothetical protein LX36DRAFT_220404 [Colletotrichum falcatum]
MVDGGCRKSCSTETQSPVFLGHSLARSLGRLGAGPGSQRLRSVFVRPQVTTMRRLNETNWTTNFRDPTDQHLHGQWRGHQLGNCPSQASNVGTSLFVGGLVSSLKHPLLNQAVQICRTLNQTGCSLCAASGDDTRHGCLEAYPYCDVTAHLMTENPKPAGKQASKRAALDGALDGGIANGETCLL